MASYYAKNGGSDSNNGLSDSDAFATPQKAYDSCIPGDIPLLKRGSVWNTELVLNKNTATVENPIQFQAYGDPNLPKPEITGAKVLTGWTSVGNGLYRYTDSAITVRINCLSFDNVSTPKGMVPRGLDYYQSTGATGSESGTITDTARMSSFGNLAGAEVISRKEHWILDRGTVTSQSGNTINFSGMGSYNVKTNWGYKLQNKAQFCTQLGDWYQDGTSIYVYFGANNPSDYDVRISFRPHCINVNGTGKHTHFENINFTYFNGRENESGNDFGPSFYFQNSPGHKFTSCDFKFFGRMVFYHYMSPFIEVSFCKVEDVMDNFWFNRFGNNQGTDLKLHRCQIRRIGAIPGAGGNGDGRYTAFHTSQVGDRIEVTENLFEDIGYNGAAIGGYNYLVQNNLFLRCNIVKDDGGCIYTFKGTINTGYNKNNRKILNNICLDSPGAPKGKWQGFENPSYKGAGKGIYIDDNQVLGSPDNITIHHNIAARCGDGMMSHNNEGLDIQYNIFYDNHDVQFKSQDDNLGVVANRNNTFKNNILYAKDSTQHAMTVHAIDGVFNHGDWNDNYYMRPTNEANIIRTTTNGSTFTNYSLPQWKATGRDSNSKGTPTTSTLSELVLNDDYDDTILHTPTRVKLDKDGVEVEEPFYLLPFEGKLLLDDLRAVDDPEPDPEQPDPNTKPELTIVSPATGSEFDLGEDVTFTVNTYDVDTADFPLHVVKQLDLYFGPEPIEKRANPVQGDNIFVWENPPVGNYVITAVATDSLEGVGSRTITISVVNPEPEPDPTFDLTVRENPMEWGTAVDLTNSGPYPAGTEVDLQATPESWTQFYRWSRDGVTLSTNQNYLYTTRAQNDTVLGEFVPKQYYLTVVVMTLGGGTVNIESGEYSEGFPIDLVATPNEGFTFDRWEKGGVVLSTEAEYTHYKTVGNETIGAFFLPIVPPELFTLTVESNPAEGGTTNVTSAEHTEGEVIPLEATPNSGYQFVNWTKNGVELATSAVLNYGTGWQDETVVANFELIPVYKTLTVESSGNGTVTDIVDQQFLVGTDVPVTATPDEGFVFKIWTVGVLIVSTESSFEYKVLDDTVLTANFERQSFNIQMLAPEVAGGSGVIVTEPPHYSGDLINIRPDILEGYEFLRWRIELSPSTWGTITEADTTFEMPVNDVKLRPEFIRKSYTVTVEYAEARGTVTELTEGPYVEGARVRFKATPLIGFRFSEWRREGSSGGVGSEYSFLMPGENVTVQAIFVPADEEPKQPEFVDLYDACIKFRLVNNLKVVMQPLSLLTDDFFDDYEHVEILEPIGWDGVHLETQRDRENHGFTAQVGIEELTFRCNTGQEFIEAAEERDGSDTDTKLVVTENDLLVSAIQLNFETYNKDVDGVYLSVEESPFDGLFATRKDIKYPFVLDQRLLMYSPSKYQITSWNYFDHALQWSPVNQSWPEYQIFRSHLIYNVLSLRNNDEISKAYQYPAAITTLIDATYNRIETMTFDRGGRVNISVDLGMVSYFRGSVEGVPHQQIPLRMLVSLFSGRGASRQDAVWVIPEQEVTKTTYQIDHYDTLGTGPVETQEPGDVEATINVFKGSWDVTVYKGDVLRISVHSVQSFDSVHSLLPNQNVAAYVVQEFVDNGTGEYHKLGTPETGGLIEVTGEFIGPASVAESVTLKDLFSEVTTKMLELDTSPVISNIGEDNIIHLIPGYALRRGEDAARKHTASFADLISGAKPLLGLGYNVEIAENSEKLRLDYTDRFYRKDRAVGIIHDLENLHGYEERADIDRTYNEVEVGFSKFSKERETNKRLTAYDTHGKQQYLTPIRKTKNKKDLISTFIGSQYEMDNVRVKQFEADAVESIMSEDDDLFMVAATDTVVQEVVVSGVKWKRGLGRVVSDRGQRELGNINGFQVRAEGILPIAVGEVVNFTPMGWGSSTIVREVRDINYQPVDYGSNQYDTLVMFDELSESEEFMAKDNVAMKLNFEPRIIPESVEPFSTVEGTQSPETSYNLRYTPKRMLLNNHQEINVGLLKKADEELITLQNIEGNSRVVTQYKDDVEFIGGDINRAVVAENGSEVLETYGNRVRLHQPYTIHATYNNVSYEFYTRVLLGHKTDTASSYGLLEIRTPFGEVVRGFLDICKFYPGERTMELTLLLYDRRPYVQDEYLATHDGTFILTTKGEFIIVKT